MNHPHTIAIHPVSHRPPITTKLTAAVSLITWLIAFVITVVSLSFCLVVGTIRAITKLSFRCIVYILLGTLFILGAILGIILSIITLGTISLP